MKSKATRCRAQGSRGRDEVVTGYKLQGAGCRVPGAGEYRLSDSGMQGRLADSICRFEITIGSLLWGVVRRFAVSSG
jgi:hypothetical protein